uniref:Uncharacterized protein n=1 Tax=Anopheles culicifacies TaxID=139723 RepID=A0A182MBS8_9DIPT
MRHGRLLLTCLPHFQSGPRMTRDPTPSIVKREGRAAAATFVGPVGTNSMLVVDEVLPQAIAFSVHRNLWTQSGFCSLLPPFESANDDREKKGSKAENGFPCLRILVDLHQIWKVALQPSSIQTVAGVDGLPGPVADISPAPLLPGVPTSGELALAEQLACTGTVVAVALSRSRSRPGRNASSSASTRVSVGAHRAYPAAFCNHTTIVPTMLLKFTSDLRNKCLYRYSCSSFCRCDMFTTCVSGAAITAELVYLITMWSRSLM